MPGFPRKKPLAQPRWAQECAVFWYGAPKKPSRGYSRSPRDRYKDNLPLELNNSQLPVCPCVQGLVINIRAGLGPHTIQCHRIQGKREFGEAAVAEYWVQGIPTENQPHSDLSQKTPLNRESGKGSAAEVDLCGSGQRKGGGSAGKHSGCQVPSVFSDGEKSIWECWE